MRKGIELEMVINGKPGALRPAARMTDPHTGIVMDVSTTQPCMVVYGDSIGDRGMGLQGFLHFLGEHLFPTCIDAHRSTAQQAYRTIGVDGGPVARYGPTHPVDDLKGRL